jgi:hypothetical protein
VLKLVLIILYLIIICCSMFLLIKCWKAKQKAFLVLALSIINIGYGISFIYIK